MKMYEKGFAYFFCLVALMFLVWFGLMEEDHNENKIVHA